MPTGSEPDTAAVAAFVRLRRDGVPQGEAARAVGLSAAWGSRFEKSEHGRLALSAASSSPPPGILNNFGSFRSTYLGHVEKAWMSEAADTVRRLLATPDPEYVVLNCPQGAGKTGFLIDLMTWLIVANRRLRCLFGADTKENASKGTGLIQSYLETQVPVWSDPDLVALGEATAATRVLAHDFGAFKGDGIWQRNQFLVDFADGGGQSNKEATVTAFGTAGVMGNRFELVGWDDLVTEEVTRSPTQNDKLCEDWDGGLGESRVEKRGHSLLLLVGQRIGPRDLYKYNLDKVRVEYVDGKETERKMYTHIRFPAHDEDLCVGVHEKGVARSWPYGCLLDAQRITWSDCATKMRNSPRAFEIQWQQRDGTLDGSIIENAWVYGGADSEGIDRPGCLNRQRDLKQVPKDWRSPLLSAITVDPSPTQFWAVQAWLRNKSINASALMQLVDKKMTSDRLLDYDGERFSGVLEDFYQASVLYGHPVTHVIFEFNAAQRWFKDNRATKEWKKARNIAIVPHTTTKLKNDPDLGLPILVDPIRSGRYDFPYADRMSRIATDVLAQQLTGNHVRNDQQMAAYFFELHCYRLTPRTKETPRLPRPSWLLREPSHA